jgi:coenzyme F420 hydrogenase subunit beta
VAKVNVKEEFSLYLKNGRVIHMPFKEVDSIARPACLVCRDFSAEYSDISFGGLGSTEGYTTSLIRSETGKQVYDGALKEGYIEERRYSSSEKATGNRTNAFAKVVSFSRRKKNRALRNRREKLVGFSGTL